MNKLLFATTNQGKLKEAREILNIEIEGIELEIDEIQSMDPVEVAVKKAKAYFREVNKPLFIEDVSLFFDGLNGLPGPYANDFLKRLGNEGLVELLKDKDNRSASAQTTIVYVDGEGKEHIFEGLIRGEVAMEPRGTNGFGWDPIFIPSGESRTFAELEDSEKHNYSMRAIALKKMKEFLSGLAQ